MMMSIYDVHGWLTGVVNGVFQKQLYYADGLDGGCWNGNISTVKWRSVSNGTYEGYNLKYDGCNRLYSAVYGSGDNLTGNRNYFSENVEYDCNGNITKLRRRGLVDNLHGSFGLVDNLHMTYEGNLLTSVCDSASRYSYAGATDFDGVPGQEYPLTYNGSGSLVSDAGRKIARIDYDHLNNPVRIQFTNGSVTRYIYSAAGEKLRVIHQTAVPNISVPIGSIRELAPSEILSADSTDYLLGGSLTMRNGRIDKLQFEEGYCQAVEYSGNASQDDFYLYYYDRDHLGNIRQVVKADRTTNGTVVQTMEYYPFGAQFCHSSTASEVQSRKYNGKELDKMHGLNTYDYGARQYNPVTARWDRVDPLCEKYYSVSPYVYCMNNPVMMADPDGRETGFPEEFIFAINHPFITLRVGIGVTKGANNISTNATRFATRGNILYGSNLRAGQDDRGSENGAFRHALWQAEITSEFGSNIARQIGDAHEDNPNIDMSQTFFSNLDDADTSADLHNNIIGRSIGKENKGAGMKNMAISILNIFKDEGLYVAKKNTRWIYLSKRKTRPH